jgi:chorismate mutase
MEKLTEFRRQLDEMDEQLVTLLARRLNICREVAAYKIEAQIPMMQHARVKEVIQRAAQNGKSKGLSESFVAALYTLIIDEACRIEDEIIESARESR